MKVGRVTKFMNLHQKTLFIELFQNQKELISKIVFGIPIKKIF